MHRDDQRKVLDNRLTPDLRICFCRSLEQMRVMFKLMRPTLLSLARRRRRSVYVARL